jgi:hypothetical protein
MAKDDWKIHNFCGRIILQKVKQENDSHVKYTSSFQFDGHHHVKFGMEVYQKYTCGTV